MSTHSLAGRKANELLWFQRRTVVQAAAAWAAAGGWAAAQAQSRSNIVNLQGDALVNGQRLSPQQTVQTGDEIQTGPGSSLVFVIGSSSFQVRQNSFLKVERGASLFAVSVLRLLTGAVVSVWGKGNSRQIVTPTLTAGIRGTGVYTEILAEKDNRSYFCNCYGTVQLESAGSKRLSRSQYHQAFWTSTNPSDENRLLPAGAINHTDEELEFLGQLVGQRTAWQLAGRKGIKDGRGQMY
jgi:hypothetical protein